MGFLADFYDNPYLYFTHTELMTKRAEFLLNHAFYGYGISFDDAIEIIKNDDTSTLTSDEAEQRDMLIGLTDNLIDFSVAEQHQALLEMAADRDDSSDYDEFVSLATGTFSKFNKTYAGIENSDVVFALGLAAEWVNYEENDIIQFTTQGDERVRQSHEALDGLRYRKKDFPAALVPPIAHACRCYLLDLKSTDGRKLTNKSNVDELISAAADPTFKHNVATSGKMFSEDHPYFQVSSGYAKQLAISARKIKRSFGI